MTLSDVMAAYPALVFEEPTVAALATQVRQLCHGSDFEQLATSYYFERALREKTGSTGLRDRWHQQQREAESGLIARCVDELRPEYGRTATAQELSSLATTRHNQVRDTVTQFVTKSLDLLDTFCQHTATLASQVQRVYVDAFDTQLDPKIDSRMHAWLARKPDATVKAVLTNTPFDHDVRANDLEEEGRDNHE